MRVLIITYDLNEPGKNYHVLLKKIKTYPGWARIGGSSYLIYTDSTPVQVRNYLSQVLDRNDKLFVGTVTAPSAWIGMSEEVSNWIHSNQ